MPEQVLVSLGQIAESAKEGLLALAVGAGVQVMYAMMDPDVIALAGPKGKHDPDRAVVRHGHEDGSVTLGGRRIAVRRPRVRTPANSPAAADTWAGGAVLATELFAGPGMGGGGGRGGLRPGLSPRPCG